MNSIKKKRDCTVLQQNASQQIPSLQVYLLPSLQIRCNGAEAIIFLKQGRVFLSILLPGIRDKHVNLAAIDNWVSTASDLFVDPSLQKCINWLLQQQIRNQNSLDQNHTAPGLLGDRQTSDACLVHIPSFPPPVSILFGIAFETEFISIVSLCVILQRVPGIFFSLMYIS